MDRGLLREALVSFESVMEKISFQVQIFFCYTNSEIFCC